MTGKMMTENAQSLAADSLAEMREAITRAATERLNEWNSADGRFNVLIAGNTGAGKSTLVNAFFGAELAVVGSGRPVTQQIEKHSVPDRPIAIYDTRGFETGDAEAVSMCEAAIEDLRRQDHEEDQLHVAWLCVDQATGRFEEAHERFVQFLAQKGVPTIIVVTRSINDPGEFEESIVARVPQQVPVVNVLAKDMPTRGGSIPADGMNGLLEETLRLVPEGRRAAVIAAQAVSWKRKDEEAASAVRKYATLAGGTAITPLPVGQMLALGTLQGKMLIDLDIIAGASTSGMMHYAKLVALATARTGGLKLFELGMAQALKLLPAFGTIAGTALGAGVAASITGALGRAYWEVTKLAVRSGKIVDNATFSDIYKREEAGGNAAA